MTVREELTQSINKSLTEKVDILIDIIPSFSWISVDKFKNVIDISINFYESRYNVYNIDLSKEITADEIETIVNEVLAKSQHHLDNLIRNLGNTKECMNQ